MLHALALLIGYFLGSIPFGLVFTNMAGLGDIREIGSGNIGATNVLRTGRKSLALATLICDSGKGGAAVFACLYLWGDTNVSLVAGGAAVFGHNFPVWLKFNGGKGVATALGTLLVASWPVGVAACLSWLVSAVLFRMSSLASIVALGTSPVFAWYLMDPPHRAPAVYLASFLAVLVIWRHRSNINRLLKGQEPRISKGGKGNTG